jgi:methionyl-tRNA formyltransferase
MRVIICCSRSWFKLSSKISNTHVVKFFSCEEELSVESINTFGPDYIFFPHWNWVVEREIHEQFNCIVFHTAPLPYGRGGSPIQNLILEGLKESPVCAIKMTAKLDAGPIYASSNISLGGTLNSIFLRINDAINDLMVDIIVKNPNPVEQEGEPHVFKRLTNSDNEITAGLKLEEVYDRIRMVDHADYPNAFIMYGDLKIEFSNAVLKDEMMELTCVMRKLN